MSEFPKVKYDAEGGRKIVHSAAEEKALGENWFNTPADAGLCAKQEYKDAPKPTTVPDPKYKKALEDAQAKIEQFDAKLKELSDENVSLQEKLEEAEDYIETLEAQLEEAQKNDHRGEDGKFKSADDEPEGTQDEAPADKPAEKDGKGFKEKKKAEGGSKKKK